MDRIESYYERLAALRPLSAEQIAQLWPVWRNDDALHVYATNAIEGNIGGLLSSEDLPQ